MSEFGPFTLPTIRPREEKKEEKKTPEQIARDEEWGDSDEEIEYQKVPGAEQPGEDIEGDNRIKPQFDPSGPVLSLAEKGFDLAKQELERLRKVTMKITNKSCAYLLANPRWAFKDGKTEINPDFVIDINGGTGEAVFQGRTLKGVLTYNLDSDFYRNHALTRPNDYVLMIVFKVLYFRGFEFDLLKIDFKSSRKNQVGAKIIRASKAELDGKKDVRGGMYMKHKHVLKHCAGRYHTYEPDSNDRDAPRLFVRFSVSDTGEADVKIIVQDA